MQDTDTLLEISHTPPATQSLISLPLSLSRTLLPQYRPAPDYEQALVQKYGPGVNPANIRATMLYSSQPEISNRHVLEGPTQECED